MKNMLFVLTVIRLISTYVAAGYEPLVFEGTDVNEVLESPEEVEDILSIDYQPTEEQVKHLYDLKAGQSIEFNIDKDGNTYKCFISRTK